jgi:exosome complex RNA-binding protein Rrp42 (RNase PH superfamily)
MPREAEISVNERAFIQEALKEQIRLDGRDFDAFRPLELAFGDEYGVADVQLGKTRCATTFIYKQWLADSSQSHCSNLGRCNHSTA